MDTRRKCVLFGLFSLLILSLVNSSCGHSMNPSYLVSNEGINTIPVADGIVDNQKKIQIYDRLATSSHNADGGFGALPPGSVRQPDLYATYFFLDSLSKLNSLTLMKYRQATIDWLKAAVQGNVTTEGKRVGALTDLFYAVMSLEVLGEKVDDENAIAEYVSRFQCLDGYYDDLTGSAPVQLVGEYYLPTFQAVSILNAAHRQVDSKTKVWLDKQWEERDSLDTIPRYQVSCCLRLTGTNPPVSQAETNSTLQVESLESIVEIHAILSLSDDSTMDPQKIYAVLSRFQRSGGGYGCFANDDVADPQGTSLSLDIFRQRNLLPPNKDETSRMILSCQLTQGGFSRIWHASSLSVTTYYATGIMSMLGVTVPSDTANYVIENLKRESRLNYVYPLVLASEILGVDVYLSPEAISNANETVRERQVNEVEGLRDLFFSIYILQRSRQAIPKEAIADIEKELSERGLFETDPVANVSDMFSLYYASKICHILGIGLPSQGNWLSGLRNMQMPDGTYQVNGYTDMVINYLIVSMLRDAGLEIPNRQQLIAWIQSCGNEYFGFQMEPGTEVECDTDPLSSTHAALVTMNLLAE